MNAFVKVAAAAVFARPGDVAGNAEEIAKAIEKARADGARAIVFPELALAGATCGDLLRYDFLCEAAEKALGRLASLAKGILAAVGLPVRRGAFVYDCAAVLWDGRVLALVPARNPENPVFAPADSSVAGPIPFAGFDDVLFTPGVVFKDDSTGAAYGVTVGRDAARPDAMANVVLNLSAEPALAGSAAFRRDAVKCLSAQYKAAYVVANAACGESTTDFVFDGFTAIAENGELLAEGRRFARQSTIVAADIDVAFLDFERRKTRCAAPADGSGSFDIGLEGAQAPACGVSRVFPRSPFVPALDAAARCEEVFAIQTNGLAARLDAIGAKSVAIGLSGGLDSALALLVSVEAFDMLGLDRQGIRVFTMPGFGTTSRTRTNAHVLCEGFGLQLETIDITPMVRQHFRDIGQDEAVRDAAYENAQARARTMILMDKANQTGGIVVGTGDLSEAALGWCTYNGDHMSMYNVNAAVPKTLVRAICKWYAQKPGANENTAAALLDILATPVSPELLPADANGQIAQKTEDKVGPYELHDYFLYHFLRRGKSKSAIAQLAKVSFAGVYPPEEIDKWLAVFFRRFATQQFKRNCSADGPATGTVGLSPRTAWRMPSDWANADM